MTSVACLFFLLNGHAGYRLLALPVVLSTLILSLIYSKADACCINWALCPLALSGTWEQEE